MERELDGLRVAVLTADGFEQVEVTSPVEALRDRGAEVEIVSLHPGRIRGVNFLYPGKKLRVDRTLFTADAQDYDALLIPGGLVGPDTLRQSERALNFVRATERAGKPIAVICHGPWLLVSAGLVARRSLTSWPGIRDDVRNAGGIWHDQEVVRDGNWVSSRGPHDLRSFNRAMVELFAEHLPAVPRRPAYREGRREAPARNAARLLGGGVMAAAALAYGVRRARARGKPREFVEVVATEAEGAELRANVREGTARRTDTAAAGSPIGGGGLAPRVE